MLNTSCDISVIVTAHNEGRLAHHTMNSLFRAIQHAKEHGVQSEVIVVLDRPDEATTGYFTAQWGPEIRIEYTDYGDPGPARNKGVTLSSGKYIALLDADDLFGKSWLTTAHAVAEKYKAPCVLHPEYSVCFERENLIAKHLGVLDDNFSLKNLLEYNYWSVFCFTQKAVLVDTPFAGTSPDSGFGYEDWHWCCEVLAQGIPVFTAPETCVFVRRKMQGSRLTGHNQNKTIIPPSRLFDPAVFTALLQKNWKERAGTD